jgi:general stress protein YciG
VSSSPPPRPASGLRAVPPPSGQLRAGGGDEEVAPCCASLAALHLRGSELLLFVEPGVTMPRRMTMAGKGAMTVGEAGRKGGRKTKQTQSPDFCKAIGEKGGAAGKERHGRDFYERIGKKGGAETRLLAAAAKGAQKS